MDQIVRADKIELKAIWSEQYESTSTHQASNQTSVFVPTPDDEGAGMLMSKETLEGILSDILEPVLEQAIKSKSKRHRDERTSSNSCAGPAGQIR